VRGDAGLSGEPMLCALEERGQAYLFKLRLTRNVKRYVEKLFWKKDWSEAGQGWEGRDGELRLSGWSRTRRVIVLRRALRGEALLADESQGVLAFVETDIPTKRYEYAVLVNDLKHELLTISQLYRDRADSENTFDELKNQWGWGGFTTHDLARCRLSALAVARQTTHGGAHHLTITHQHAKADKAKSLLAGIHGLLDRLKVAAEQLKTKSVWQRVCEHILSTVATFKPRILRLLSPPTPVNCCF